MPPRPDQPPRRSAVTALRAVTALAVVYSTVHFAFSGIRQPLDHPNLDKFHEHASPLQEHLRTGAPVHSVHPAQYGPVFLFVMHPLLRGDPDDVQLARWLYAIQLACIAGSFLLTCATLRPLVRRADVWPMVVVWLAIIWINFAPLYTIVSLKSVETWELFLISLALYAYVRDRRWTPAAAIAAAGLIKVLPFAFMYYWLITDRRTFARSVAIVAIVLSMGGALYGREMGFAYLQRVVAGAAGSSYGLDWHENVSLKAAVAKAFGTLPAPTSDAARTSGYFIALTGWRRIAATVLGDAAVLAVVAALTWMWHRRTMGRSVETIVWEWSLLAVVTLIVSPNTIFEYCTIALGAIGYAFVRLVSVGRRNKVAIAGFLASLLLLGGVVPRQWLNRIVLIDLWKRWGGHDHLNASEAYQYYGFPLIGLILLAVTIWRLRPEPARM